MGSIIIQLALKGSVSVRVVNVFLAIIDLSKDNLTIDKPETSTHAAHMQFQAITTGIQEL
jgi:hypothetical protein